ncbi:MAG: PKD domain-containing protein, partial [Bryobacteraceae bacterium]
MQLSEVNMRYVYLAAIVALSVSIPSVSNGQSAPFSITNYQLVSRQYVSASQSSVTYRAELANPGPAAGAVTATVTSRSPKMIVVPGQHNLHFSFVPANDSVASSDTFTVLADNNATFDPTDLHWSFTAPVANAGRGQTAGVSGTVTLDGSGSANPSAAGTLAYSWEFASRPAGSNARLDNETTAMPSFIVDVPGDYSIVLTVSNGSETDSASVKVSTRNTPPVANAGPNQTAGVGATVIHNGSGSSDVDGDALTYSWTLVTKPAGSTATLSGPNTVSPTFVVDKPGMYVAQLVVNDGLADSTPSTVTITTQNTPPIAHAGRAQIVTTGALVQLNGAGSTDVDGNPLTYSWNLITLPSGSKSALSNLTAVNPTFTADVPGIYVAQLIVNDGFADSTPETIAITTNAVRAPTANAGPNQTVRHNSTVILNGFGTDLQDLPLTYQLALIAKPAGSNAVLSTANIPNATFVADLPGTYVAQLIVNNGVLSSAPATVTITTTNTPPVTNAGRSQNVAVGANVQLDGSGSSDADRDPLTHSWSLISRPNGSKATLFSPTEKSPMFVADVAGTYVVQLIVNDGYTNGNPSTVTITASAAPAITLTPNRLSLGRDHGTLTVNLSAPAGEGGQEVDLAISDSEVASVPARVTIPQGSTGANVKVPRGVKGGNATITASAMSFAGATAEVVGSSTIVLPTVAVAPGQQVQFPVTITPAPTSTVFVSLTSSNTAAATLSATTLIFDAGSTTPSSTPTLKGVAAGSTTISASATNFTTVTETIQVAPNIAFSPATSTVSGFVTKNLTLVMSSAAPAGGQVINLSSSNTSVATVPPTVTIAANSTTVSVPVTGIGFGTTTIDANGLPTLLDTYAAVTVASAGTVNVPASASVGNLQTVSFPISLSSAAPTGGVTVTLSSTDTTTLTISPATVTIAAGSTTPSTQPTITGVAVGSATINASAPGYTSSSLLVPVNNVQISLPSGASVALAASTSFQVTLATPAPTGGLTVTLSSSNTSTASVTSTVTIAAGATTPVTQPQVKGVNVGSANITATAPGYIAATQPVSVTAAVTFNPTAVSVAATASMNSTLTLSAAAPTGGVTVNLTSNNTGVATVPATVTFAAGATSTTFAVTGVAAGSTTITAGSSPNIPNATLTLTVTPPGSIGTPSGLAVSLTQSVPFPITLSTPAPTGGVTVTLASSNTSTISISPSTVQIAANAVAPATQPQVTGVNLGSANITASAPGYTTATQSVSGTATVTFSPSSMTVGLNSSQNLTLTLSAKAPTGGVTVNLSSGNTGIATVPLTATFSAGATTALAPLTALGNLGSTVIQASATGIANATANVTVAQLPSIILPANLTVALGKTASLPVSLQTAAPTGGVTVTLISSNTSVTVTPASVTIAAGSLTPTSQPNVTGVNFAGATISATATGYASSSVPVLVNTTAVLSPTSATIIGTNAATFTLTLGASVPAGGVTISLSSSNTAAATVPATVTIATGTTATFAVSGVAPGSTTITASALPNIGSVTANVTVNPPGTITLNPATPALGQTAAFPISISPAAPTGGVTIALSSSNTSIAKMSVTTVTIPAGATSPTTSPNITGVNLGSATITASATNYTTATQSTQVTATVTVTPLSLVVGNTANMTLTLSAAAPTGGITVSLGSSDTSVATVPATATFLSGSKTTTVPVTALAVGTSTMDASNPTGIADATGTVTVNPPGIISIPSTPTVGLKTSTSFPITLLTPAPTGGVTLTLSSSNTSMATVSPASITIAAGGVSPSVQPTITGANIGSANITVSAPNYTTSTATAQVTGTLTSITPASPLIYGTATQTFTLTLSTTAPTGGITLNLSSSNTSVATVPATVTIPANASTVTFVATGVAAGQTTITAGLPPNIANISASLTDANPGTITLNPLALGKGQSGSLGIFLTPAPTVNTTVTLTSSNT